MEKRITIQDVANKAGTSKRTVSRVINNSPQVNKKTREKILNVISKLNYSPNIIARSLSSKTSKTIGLIILDIYSPFFSPIIRGIESIAESYNYSVVISESKNSIESEKKHLNTLLDRMVDGIIINPATKNLKHIEKVANMGVKIVILGRPEIYNINIDSVYTNEFEGVVKAIQYLVDCGHEKIIFINGNIENLAVSYRLKGYKDALKRNDISFNKDLVFNTDVTIKGGYTISDKIFNSNQDFTAIMCFNDMIAMGVLKYCNENRIRVPEDFSLVGFDDIFCTSLLSPPLTTIQQQKTAMGEKIAELLFNKLNNSADPSHIEFETNLIIRKSVKNIK